MIEFFVKRPVTTIVFVLFFVVLGIVSYLNLYTELTPKVDFPIITIGVVYPGATPDEVENQIIKDIEDVVSEISEIDKIKSRAYENFAMITIEFDLGVDVDIKSIEVKDKVEAIVNDLPDGAEKPLIEKFDPMAQPVADFVLTSDTLDERTLYEYLDKTLKYKFASIAGVASVDMFGGRERQINIFLDPVIAKNRFVSIADIVNEIKTRNLNVPGGTIDKKDNSVSVRFMGEFPDVASINKMEIVSRDGEKMRLEDVARVEDSHKKIDRIARYNQRSAVGFSAIKTNDGNVVAIAELIRKKLPSIMEQLPEGFDLALVNDNSEYVQEEINDTLVNILIGIFLTVIILYLFTGNGRVTLIAAVVIPSSVIATMFAMDLSGFSINIMTLLAIAMGMGTLIANAIVVIESILFHVRHQESPQQAAISGTKEITGAVFASAGTNVVVFTPIAFMGGIAGEFMEPFGLTVVYATLFSLLFSFSLTPMLCGLLMRPKSERDELVTKSHNPIVHNSRRLIDSALKGYKNFYKIMFEHPKKSFGIILLLLIGSLFFVRYIGAEFMSATDQGMVDIKVTMPQGTTIDRTLEVVKNVEAIIVKNEEVESMLSDIGNNGNENALIKVSLVSISDRDRSDFDIIKDLVPELSRIPDAEIELIRGEAVGTSEADVTLNVVGTNYGKMIGYSTQIMDRMEGLGYFRTVMSSYKEPKSELRFHPNQEKMTYHGISYAELANVIKTSIYGDDSNKFKDAGEEYDINVEMDKWYKSSFDDVEQVNIITKKGLLPITELGSIDKKKAVPNIWRRDRSRIIQINGYLSKGTSGDVMSDLDSRFEDIDFEPGYGYAWVGNAEMQEESQGEISKAFILAAILTFMLLAGILNSFVHPLTIASTIITSFSGVFLAMFFMGSSINLASMMAMVMLVGLVVNNSILLLDSVISKMKDGIELKEAIASGLHDKFEAILMTSIAIICGVLPQMFSNHALKSAMGTVLVGGVAASILLSFTMVPLMFYYMEVLRNKIHKYR
jgi:hydrophobic/amphiphilic exporter-1 (mainly G- bacteria), HAE1 family